MGLNRNGARLFLELIQKLCKLSHNPGFEPGVHRIIGEPYATDILSQWAVICPIVEGAIAADDYFNRLDARADSTGDEDLDLAT